MPDGRSLASRLVRRGFLGVLLPAAMLFIPAGTLNFWQGWVFLAINLVFSVLLVFYFYKRDPQLIERRLLRKEKVSEQKLVQKLGGLIFFPAFVLLGLDYRFGLSRQSAATTEAKAEGPAIAGGCGLACARSLGPRGPLSCNAEQIPFRHYPNVSSVAGSRPQGPISGGTISCIREKGSPGNQGFAGFSDASQRSWCGRGNQRRMGTRTLFRPVRTVALYLCR